MPDKTMTPEERDRIAKTLRYLRAWLRYRGMTQTQLAERMGVSEGQMSKWMRFNIAMNVEQLTRVAQILDAKPEDLLFPPPSNEETARYRKVAELANALDPDAFAAWIAAGNAMRPNR